MTVPGITQAALDAVPDYNTRQVLQELVTGWQTRNGQTGSNGEAFLTEAQLRQLAAHGTLNSIIKREAANVVNGLFGLELDGGSFINQTALYNSIFESQAFKDLTKTVDLIEKPGGIFDMLKETGTKIESVTKAYQDGDKAVGTRIDNMGLRVGEAETVQKNETKLRIEGQTALSEQLKVLGTRVGDAEAGLKEETKQRVNDRNAIQESIKTQFTAVGKSLALIQEKQTTMSNDAASYASAINQLQTSLDGAYAAIQEERTARIAADGVAYSQWRISVDVNKRVAGIALGNDGTVSNFIVTADTFSIVNAGGDRAATIMRNNTIMVFDENARLRVQLGQLS